MFARSAKYSFLTLFLMMGIVSGADDRVDVTASNFSPAYYSSVMPTFKYYAVGTNLHANTTYSIHNTIDQTVIIQFHTDGTGHITDGDGSRSFQPTAAIGNGCTGAGTPDCPGVPISGLEAGRLLPAFADDGSLQHVACSGGYGAVTCHRIYYPNGGPVPQPGVTNPIINVTYFINTTPRTSHWKGQIGCNCATPHHVTLKVDDVTIQDLTTSAGATYNSPSIVTIDATLTEASPNGQAGKPWAFYVDDLPVFTGNIVWVGTDTIANYYMHPQTFDCAGVVGTAKFHGRTTVGANSGVHSLSLHVAGQLTAQKSSTANGSTAQDLIIDATVANLEQTTLYEWKMDGKTATGLRQIDPFKPQ
jgi:hypothetical protein